MLRQQFLQIKIDQLNKEMYINLGEYQNLKAEWNYLNNKDYLKMLGAKYLPEMAESKNKSFGQIEKVPIK